MYFVCLLVSSHRHILISVGSCTTGACWYPHTLTSSYISVVSGTPGACWYPRILTSSYPYRFMNYGCLVVSSHPHILISLVSFTPGACWYPHSHILISLDSSKVLVDIPASSSHPHIPVIISQGLGTPSNITSNR